MAAGIIAASLWDHIWLMEPMAETAHKFDDDPHRMFVRGYHLDEVIETSPVELGEKFSLVLWPKSSIRLLPALRLVSKPPTVVKV